VIGKAEGANTEWHGHITALTVAPEYHRLGLAGKLVALLETVSDEVYKGFFVDLYVRCANTIAVNMYEGFGYSVYRRVREYYGSLDAGGGGRDEEDAFGEIPTYYNLDLERSSSFLSLPFSDMRKPLSKDSARRSIRPNGRDMIVSAHDVS
jgi:N-terminal acetyltransferase B complex catalytic subunit